MSELIYYPTALGLSMLINYLFVRFWKFDFLKSTVKSDRWGTKVVPLTGGTATFLVFFAFSLFKLSEFWPHSPQVIVALAGGILMFLLGLVDDIVDLKSYQKFLFQIFIVLLVIGFGIKATLFGMPFNYIITFLWILGITNAFNLLDNIDGLAAGIAAIALIFLGLNFSGEGAPLLGYFCFTLAAVLMGFLVFNFKPARLYLGDSGALFTGYFLAVLTILGSQRSGRSLFVTIIFPLLIMLIPIMDTLMVSITRRLRGQSPFQGGRDHLSHRLVMLGMSEKQAVLLLYLISTLLGVSTLIFIGTSPVFSMIVYFFISLMIVLFCVYIGKIKIVSQSEIHDDFVVISTNFLYKKRILHILVDLLLVALVYYFSYLIRFEGNIARSDMKLFVVSMPIIIFFKIICLYWFNVYKIESRYFSIPDGLNILKGVSLGSILTIILLTFVTRFKGYSRAVFVIDWMLTIIVLGGVKLFYRVFDELFYSIRSKGNQKVVVVGHKRTFQAVNRYLKLKSNLNLSVVRFFPLTEFNYDVMMEYINKLDDKISMILLEDKGVLSKEDSKQILKKNIKILDEREFFLDILE